MRLQSVSSEELQLMSARELITLTAEGGGVYQVGELVISVEPQGNKFLCMICFTEGNVAWFHLGGGIHTP